MGLSSTEVLCVGKWYVCSSRACYEYSKRSLTHSKPQISDRTTISDSTHNHPHACSLWSVSALSAETVCCCSLRLSVNISYLEKIVCHLLKICLIVWALGVSPHRYMLLPTCGNFWKGHFPINRQNNHKNFFKKPLIKQHETSQNHTWNLCVPQEIKPCFIQIRIPFCSIDKLAGMRINLQHTDLEVLRQSSEDITFIWWLHRLMLPSSVYRYNCIYLKMKEGRPVRQHSQ